VARKSVTNGVDAYIASCPKEAQDNLAKMRAAIQAVARRGRADRLL
jgi:hypothetical protein